MVRSPSLSLPLIVLALVVLLAVALRILGPGTGGRRQGTETQESCSSPGSEACLPGVAGTEKVPPDRRRERKFTSPLDLILPAGEVCQDVGYLCADVRRFDTLRIIRWPEDTPLLRIWIPPPPGLPPETARALRRAAAAGIGIWQDQPFPLSISLRAIASAPDITVRWVDDLGPGRLGHTQIGGTLAGGRLRVEVKGLQLVTRFPSGPGEVISPEQLRLVAAHEMGHALGLPHSDDPSDVMYPQNTAWRRTRRDFETVQALYRMPNGALIRIR